MKYTQVLIFSLLVLGVCVAKDCQYDDAGLTAFVGIVGYDIAVSATEQESFVESSFTTIDYKGQRLFVAYEIVENGSIYRGQVVAFGQNQTEYYLSVDANNQTTCTEAALTYKIPTGLPWSNMTKGGYARIGKFDVATFILKEALTTSEVLYDDEGCAIVSINTENNNQSTPGVSISNYFDYDNGYNEAMFYLPSACSTPSQTMKYKRTNLPDQLLGNRFI
ncbi:hypothetical protein DLAC_07111 [Tieghemostelium lacteum]|uniref:Uncharacterized protein n=1 Tax=Tieghemostelium lacteum TaxID=361077 RepID=A0A151ZE79_TIELA|nr:hypothetical protein DLAC_07111 [Tieghemostelium lacteum]|eukprot:KYQ92263.1 hypothetical protein DLAC_07111 [Tieghemostelium lacteum]